MPSKESLGRKLVEETEADCHCGNYSMSTVADLLDEAIREAQIEVLGHLIDQHAIISFPIGSGFNRQFLVKDYAAQLRESKP